MASCKKKKGNLNDYELHGLHREELKRRESELNKRETEKNSRPSKRLKKDDRNNAENAVTKTDPKIVAFYAEKGGVGKTTLCITLAHMFSLKHRVLIYDVDSQRSATSWLFGNELSSHLDLNGDLNKLIDRNFDNFFRSNPGKSHVDFQKTLFDQVMDTDHDIIKPAYAHEIRNNLFLVPGHSKTSILDYQITIIELLSGVDPNVKNTKTGKPFCAIMATAKQFNIDFVFVDLNPNTGVLNQRLIMTSHFLITPAIPDFFSYEMMKSVADNLVEWQKMLVKYSIGANASNFKLPNHAVKFMGYILNM